MAGTTDTDNPFVDWLLAQISSRGWTSAELAKRMDMNQGNLSNILTRKVNLGPDVARRMADALGVPQIELFAVAKLIDQPISPRNAAEAELMKLADDLTDDDRDTLIWFAKSLRQKQEAKTRNEKINPAFRPSGKGAKA